MEAESFPRQSLLLRLRQGYVVSYCYTEDRVDVILRGTEFPDAGFTQRVVLP